MIIIGLIEHIVDEGGGITGGTINDNHEVIIEALMEVHFKATARRNAMYVASLVAGRQGTLLISEKKHITSFVRAHGTLAVMRLLQLTFKPSWLNTKA
jgi:hypothetical protein